MRNDLETWNYLSRHGGKDREGLRASDRRLFGAHPPDNSRVRERKREKEREREKVSLKRLGCSCFLEFDEFDARAVTARTPALFPFRALSAGNGNTFMACIN